MSGAAARWAEQLAAWAIPEEILAAVPDSPWTLPTEVFARRADSYVAQPTGASYALASEALGRSGSVLDVGAGAGAASLPLADRTAELIAVDTSATMLDALRERADRLDLALTTVVGRWPEIAPAVAPADVVVCHHVFYNAPDLDRFAVALNDHARRRVVVELTPAHPLRALNPLWRRMHGISRPEGPTVDDAVAVLFEVGVAPLQQRWPRPARHEYTSFADLVAATRRRLCLPPERDAELAQVLQELGADPAHPRDLGEPGEELVTLWWEPTR